MICVIYADRAITVVFAGFGPTPMFSFIKVALKFFENLPKPWSWSDLTVSAL